MARMIEEVGRNMPVHDQGGGNRRNKVGRNPGRKKGGEDVWSQSWRELREYGWRDEMKKKRGTWN